MPRPPRHWRELFGGLGEAFFELLGAEIEALRRDFARSGRGLFAVLGYFAAALALAFWLLALVLAFLVALLAIWLPVWAATLSTLIALLAVTGALVGVGYRRLKRLEGPGRIVERRWQDHVEWWHERVLSEPAEGAAREEER
jgi:hypothetical protein